MALLEIEEVAKKRGHEIVCIIDYDNQEDFKKSGYFRGMLRTLW